MLIIKKNLSITRNIMFLINLIIILFMSSIIFYTTELICENDMARSFIEKVKYIPMVPWKVPVIAMTFFIILLINVLIRDRLLRRTSRKVFFYLFSFLDILICIAITYSVNMSYKGILLLAIANIIIYIDDKKKRTLFIIMAIFSYIVFDYDILSIKIKMFSINEYVKYYTASQRFYIFGIRNVMNSLNEMSFILFMIFVIQSEIDENQKIKELYEKLFQTAEELKVANIQLQEYADKSEKMAKIRERNRLAREIHDTLGHALTGIATGLEACMELFNIDIERTKIQLLKIKDLAKQGLVDVRRSMNELRPDTLERFSLIPAVQKLADDISGCTHTKVSVQIIGDVPKLGSDEEGIIYRIVQEGITNAVRHGKAKNICMMLHFNYSNLYLDIIDDGIGCHTVKDGFGLKHIKERVGMLKGTVQFETGIGKGFTAHVKIPIRGTNP
ncbi:MAG: sensor histidine kinase [Bacillota bacterium]